ncbi:MAG: hypothetical protein ACJARS_000712, partial [bacterium]
MSLFEDGATGEVSPEDAVVVAHAFMQKLREWAVDREIPKLTTRLERD